MKKHNIKELLDNTLQQQRGHLFTQSDPISIPHLFSTPQDIEIAGFFSAIFAWGHRKIILQKSLDLLKRMDMNPYQFIIQHQECDLKALLGFKHRTFSTEDILYFIAFLTYHYHSNKSLETAFIHGETMADKLNYFYDYFFSLPFALTRTKKHISRPSKGSTCKRINMYLRWMVRPNQENIDFGIWKHIQPQELICPIDIHVARVAKDIGLLPQHTHINWDAAVYLTQQLKKFNATDPVKYDIALFSLGVMGKM